MTPRNKLDNIGDKLKEATEGIVTAYNALQEALESDLRIPTIDWTKVDTDTKELEEKEALNEDKWDMHKEQCSGCSLCEI